MCHMGVIKFKNSAFDNTMVSNKPLSTPTRALTIVEYIYRVWEQLMDRPML